MKVRIAMWAGAGFLLAGAWALLAAVTSPESFLTLVREPLVQVLLNLTCPVAYLGRHYPIQLWCVLLTNAATFGLLGFVVEVVRARARRHITA